MRLGVSNATSFNPQGNPTEGIVGSFRILESVPLGQKRTGDNQMKLRQRLKELENEAGYLKGVLHECLTAIDKIITAIEQVKEDSDNAQHQKT